ncbi:GNAT family N-acetyltransferase [Aeromicrobium sp.]|uniref:GNAT family N-acetyltransferase n=1 Tax=Aeromicrobium sp. TaxID=1871063 RepID=UPI0030C4609F
MTVTLEPMTAERFVSWREHHVAAYAEEKVASGNWPAEGAAERAAKENAELLPQGVETPAHDLFIGVVDGREIGFLWLFTDPAPAAPEISIYDIEVVEGQRGKGYGRGLLEAAEGWCADHSIAVLKLHVFGFNTTAISLYESSGFETTNVAMAKRIR